MVTAVRPSKTLAVLVATLVAAVSCSGGSNSHADTANGGVPENMATATMLRGTVSSISPTELVVQTNTNSVTVKLAKPFQVFERASADLSRIGENAFIGVTSVKQSDGSERATEIHIFPEALRGMGEGSRMIAPPANAAQGGGGGRMTNGSVVPPDAGASRMSNGNVASTDGKTLVVQYEGGSRTVTVPPTTPVTEIQPVQKQLAVGDQVVVVAQKSSDGTFTSGKVLLATK